MSDDLSETGLETIPEVDEGVDQATIDLIACAEAIANAKVEGKGDDGRRHLPHIKITKPREYKPRLKHTESTTSLAVRFPDSQIRQMAILKDFEGLPFKNLADVVREAVDVYLEAVDDDLKAKHPMIESYLHASRARRQAEWDASQRWEGTRQIHREVEHVWGVLLDGDLDEVHKALTRAWEGATGISVRYWRQRRTRAFLASAMLMAAGRVLLRNGYTLPADLTKELRGGS